MATDDSTASVAVEQLRATEEALQRHNKILLGLARSEAIDGGNLEIAFREITEAAAEGLGIERAGIWMYEDESKEAMSCPDLFLRSKAEHQTAPVLSHSDFPTYFEWLARERALPAHNAHTYPGTAELSEAYLTPLGIGSLLDAPIRWHGKMVGLVCNEHVGEPREWSQDEINFAGSMADLVTRALEANERATTQKKLEEANRTLESRVQARTEELQASNEALEALNRAKNEMFQNVSHELRTPLTLILSPIEMLLESHAQEEGVRKRLTSVRRNALRLLALINDLLDLAKMESAALQPHLRPVDVAALVSRIATDIQPAAQGRGVELTWCTPDAGTFHHLDDRLLERVALNLLSNALKFTPAGGSIDLRVEPSASGIDLVVADSGVGIAPEAQKRIFRRFEQADTKTTRTHGGTGIGLALVAQMVDVLGGTVDVLSAPGEGSTFTVRFPDELRCDAPALVDATSHVAKDLARQAAYLSLEEQPVTQSEYGEHGPLVVLAEDDDAIRVELAEMLAPDYRVIACRDGEEALEAVLRCNPHLVVSDVMMPKMDGHQLTEAIRERPEFRDTAIVLVSARGDLEDRIQARQLGVDTYLAKPYHPSEVRATLEGLLRSRMRLIGSFLVHDILGQGSQSQVFLAAHRTGGEPVALKVMSQKGSHDPETSERLRVERETLARITHPNIVRVVEHGEHEGRHYLALEYLAGASLGKIVQHAGRIPDGTAAAIGVAIARALSVVHDTGFIHRDVKCDNVMVEEGEGSVVARTRLIDFGTVLAAEAEPTDTIVGTLPYLAPELYRGGMSSPSSDLYATGVSLFLMVTGTLPYQGNTRSEMMSAVTNGAVPRTTDRVPDTSHALADVIAKAMHRDPASRYASADALAAALEALGLPEAPVTLPEVQRTPTELTSTSI